MSNDINILPINDLLDMNFFIPSYQRGYRWTEQQVKDLLNDIDAFTAENNSWYCLQPLVVKKMSDKDKKTNKLSEEWYEVIDGQQRITTIDLFIHYFNEMWVGKQKVRESQLKYETRGQSAKFLQQIEIDLETNTVKVEDVNNLDNIDFYHISEAYQTIHDWVSKKGSAFDKNKFQSKFIFSTQVIWYEIQDNKNSPIDTFIRINMGKIPLTNSELIKALFLQKRNFNDATAELRQIEIANEWDRMEYALQNEDFWWFLNKEKNEMSARIEFLFDLMCAVAKKEDANLQKRIGTDNYETFRFFNEKFSNTPNLDTVKDAWNEVRDYFLAFEEWFNEPIWYHYIGYLIYCETSIVDIFNLYEGCLKDEFLKKLKKNIKENYTNIYCKELKTDSNTTYSIDLPFENKNKQKIRELLLLFNIEYIVKQYEAVRKTENSELFIRFPFEIFKKENWDIEHIDSFTENEIKEKNTQKEWLENAVNDLPDVISEELRKEVQLFIDNDNKAILFSELKSKIVEIAEEDENDEYVKNSIGNLTLLDSQTNRSYKNALFPTKRRIIIEKDTAGKFIPICTKNVFLKYFARKVPSLKRWTSNDIVNYQNHIGVILTDFLTFQIASNDEQ
jgi:uncharacterized protein with ParB-like and HNH nuclease domain